MSPLRSRHILRGRAETRDCDSRFSAALHTVSRRHAERNRYVGTPLHLCRAYTLQELQFLRCGYGISAESAEPVTSLVILSCSNLSAYTPSLKLLPPARLTRPKVIAVVTSFDCQCQSRKDRHLSPQPSYRPAPAAPIGLPAHSPEDRKNNALASPFPTSCESSGEYTHASRSVRIGTTSHAEVISIL